MTSTYSLSAGTRLTVEIGVGVSIIVLIVTGTWFVAAAYTRLNVLERDHFGIAAAAEVALRQAIANPGMKVPDPRDPSRVIVVIGKPISFDGGLP